MLGKIKPIRKYGSDAIEEVFQWYRDAVISNALGTILESLRGEGAELPDETLQILAGVWYMDRLEDNACRAWRKCAYADSVADFIETAALSKAQIEKEMSEYLANGYEDVPLYECVVSNLQKFTELAAGFVGMTMKEVLPAALGAEYMFYDTLETHWFISEAILADEACLFGCGHMG